MEELFFLLNVEGLLFYIYIYLLYYGKNTYPEICCFSTHKVHSTVLWTAGMWYRGLWKLRFADLKLPSWIRNPLPALFSQGDDFHGICRKLLHCQ